MMSLALSKQVNAAFSPFRADGDTALYLAAIAFLILVRLYA